jgi:hypothetical protein
MIMLAGHTARRHLIKLFLVQFGNRSAASDKCFESLHFLELDGGHKIPRCPAMTGYRNRLALGNVPVLTEIPDKFSGRDFAHQTSLSMTEFTHFAHFIKAT